MNNLNRGGRKKRKTNDSRNMAPPYYLIATEGIATEVNYFEGIKSEINKKYKDRMKVQKISLKVKGIGKGTVSLVEEVVKRRSLGNYSEVWVVFDKDEFQDFDDAIRLAKKEGLKVAWTNESFELWILLHFQNLDVPLPRDQYNQKLNKHFKKLKYNHGEYDKNIENIFELTKDKILIAIERSEELLSEHKYNKIYEYSKMNPATTVQELIKDLLPYIKQRLVYD